MTQSELQLHVTNDPVYMEKVAPDFREDLKIVGKAKRKVDGAKLVRGEKAFVEDMVEAGSCYLKMLRSPHAHAYIKNIDIKDAKELPGVVYILTSKNCPDIYNNQAGQGFPEPSPYDRKMFGDKVLHVGDRVAAVVAETVEIAQEAVKKIKHHCRFNQVSVTVLIAVDVSLFLYIKILDTGFYRL